MKVGLSVCSNGQDPGRWTVHIVIGKKEEIDEELLNWVRAAWIFAESKGKGRKKQK